MEVDIRRSTRRKRTASASVREGRIMVMVPAGLDAHEERRLVESLVARVRRGSAKRALSDAALSRRAAELSRIYLDGRATPTSIRWVTNQNTRWGSCTPNTGTIRISARVAAMPGWVLDAVIVHELSHLLVPGHGATFWAWARRYPRTGEALTYLQGYAAGARLEPEGQETGSDELRGHEEGSHGAWEAPPD
ncbi:MAG: M48 family metallopeptidase [Nocardioides sp.]